MSVGPLTVASLDSRHDVSRTGASGPFSLIPPIEEVRDAVHSQRRITSVRASGVQDS